MTRKRRRNRKRISRQVYFWPSLENYVYSRLKSSNVKWETIAITLTAIVIGASAAAGYFENRKLASNPYEVIEEAAKYGDYELAQKLLTIQQSNSPTENKVLGAETELEELVYPERKIEREIERTQEINSNYPNNRDLLIRLSRLYKLIGKTSEAEQIWEEAKKLDPNNEIFK